MRLGVRRIAMPFRLISNDPKQRKQEIAILVVGLGLLLFLPRLSPLWWPINKAKLDQFCQAYPVGTQVQGPQVLEAARRAGLESWDRQDGRTTEVTVHAVLWLRVMRMGEVKISDGRVAANTVRTFSP